MIVAIVGSREFVNLARVSRYVTALAAKYPDAVLVSGGARGVDTMAERTARACGLAVISYRPYSFDSIYDRTLWTIETITHGGSAQEVVVSKHRRISPPCFPSFGKAAFFRNGWIVDDADRFVAFWDGVSAGAGNAIGLANKADKPRYIYRDEA